MPSTAALTEDEMSSISKSTDNVVTITANGSKEDASQVHEKPASTMSTESPPAATIGPPPDGGATAWLQVLGGHLAVFNSWGYISSFGVFQAYYADTLGRSPSDISWIGSVQVFLIYFISMFSGRATDAGYFRHSIIAGSLLQLIGVFMASISTKYWQLFITQGICVGLGDGLVFCPTVTLISTYFLKRRALAISGIANGFVTGGVVFTVIARQLLYRIGLAWTLRVMGFVLLANSLLMVSILRTRLPPRGTGPLVEFAAFKEVSYDLFSSGMFFAFVGVYFAYYYIAPFAEDIIGLSPTSSLNLLMVMNAVGVPGRIVPALLADHLLGPVNTLILFVAASGILVYSWSATNTLSSLWAFVIIYGFFGAGVQSLFPPALGSLTKDLSKLGIQIGMVFSIISVGCLTGPPIAGALITANNGDYLYAQMFGGSIMLLGATLLTAGRIIRTGPHFLRKA